MDVDVKTKTSLLMLMVRGFTHWACGLFRSMTQMFQARRALQDMLSFRLVSLLLGESYIPLRIYALLIEIHFRESTSNLPPSVNLKTSLIPQGLSC